MELCVHVKCSTKEQHQRLVSLCSSQPGFYIDLEQSWVSWVAETRTQEQPNAADAKPRCDRCDWCFENFYNFCHNCGKNLRR